MLLTPSLSSFLCEVNPFINLPVGGQKERISFTRDYVA